MKFCRTEHADVVYNYELEIDEDLVAVINNDLQDSPFADLVGDPITLDELIDVLRCKPTRFDKITYNFPHYMQTLAGYIDSCIHDVMWNATTPETSEEDFYDSDEWLEGDDEEDE